MSKNKRGLIPDDLDLEELAERAEKWTSSLEGQKAIHDAMQRAEETIEMLQEARRVKPEQLYCPLGF